MLDQGNVIEYDYISKLQTDTSSHFYDMLSKSDELKDNLDWLQLYLLIFISVYYHLLSFIIIYCYLSAFITIQMGM